jgi:hypothetical protein
MIAGEAEPLINPSAVGGTSCNRLRVFFGERNQMQNAKLVSCIVVLALSLVGCGSRSNSAESETPDPTPTPTTPPTALPSTTPTATTEVAGIGGGGTSEEQTTPTSVHTQVIPETQPDGPEVASCLLGTWSVVHESLVGYLTEAFDQSGFITFNFQTGQGDLFLTFNQDGLTNFRAANLELLVAIPDLADFLFIVQGDGLAQYAADEEVIATWGHVSAITSEGGGDIGDQSTDAAAVVVLTPEQIFLDSTGEHVTFTWVDVPEDARSTFYTCSGNSLTLNIDGTLTSEWVRASED